MDEETLQQALRTAEALCTRRGVRFTAQRRRVLELVCRAERPVGAYEILDQLREGTTATAAPPTVYRALDFLLEQGLVHKLETLHAFIGCTHPEHPHASQFLICSDCGQVKELENAAISGSLRSLEQETGFHTERPVIEVLGTCAHCRRKTEAT